MHRRGFLAGTGVALPALLAGCLNSASTADDDGNGSGQDGDGSDGDGAGDADGSSGDDSNGDTGGDSSGNTSGEKDSVPVITGYEVSESVAEPDAERTDGTDAWGLFVASEDAAERYYGDVEDDGVATFVEKADFEGGDRLVYLQAYGPQTCYAMALDGDPFVSSNGTPTVEAIVERTAGEDEFCGDAMTLVEVLLRITFDLDASTTDVLEAEIAGSQDQPEELTLEARR